MKKYKLFILAVLLLGFSFTQELLNGDSRSERVIDDFYKNWVNDIIDNYLYHSEFSSVSEVHSAYVVPQNPHPIPKFTTGDVSTILVGVKNNGESTLTNVAIRADLYHPNDHHRIVQKIPLILINRIPPSVTATREYMFAAASYLKSGTYDFVGIVYYCINDRQFQSTYYNGTVEITVAIRVLDVIAQTLFFILLIILGMCARYRILIDITEEVKKSQHIAYLREFLNQ